MDWSKKYGDPLAHLNALNSASFIEYIDEETRGPRKSGSKPVLLDGKLVAPAVIDPQLHEYLGTFRPPVCPDIPPGILSNGEWHLKYKDGAFDLLSYVTKGHADLSEKNEIADEWAAEIERLKELNNELFHALRGVMNYVCVSPADHGDSQSEYWISYRRAQALLAKVGRDL